MSLHSHLALEAHPRESSPFFPAGLVTTPWGSPLHPLSSGWGREWCQKRGLEQVLGHSSLHRPSEPAPAALPGCATLGFASSQWLCRERGWLLKLVGLRGPNGNACYFYLLGERPGHCRRIAALLGPLSSLLPQTLRLWLRPHLWAQEKRAGEGDSKARRVPESVPASDQRELFWGKIRELKTQSHRIQSPGSGLGHGKTSG